MDANRFVDLLIPRLRYQCHLMLISHEKHRLVLCLSCMRRSQGLT
jgi:hypothetical protein